MSYVAQLFAVDTSVLLATLSLAAKYMISLLLISSTNGLTNKNGPPGIGWILSKAVSTPLLYFCRYIPPVLGF